MHSSFRFLRGVVCVCLAVLWGTPDARAQDALLPAVDLTYTRLETGDVWPADLNRDGITDLVGRAFDPTRRVFTLSAVLGRGDGTFGDLIRSTYQATPWAVGDLNRDGKIDVLAVNNQPPDDRRTLTLAMGNGNGTFGPARTIAASAAGAFTFALIVDLDGNGTRDIVVGEEPDLVTIYSGNGDLTFSPPVMLVTGRGPRDGITGDFNGDGLRDLAVANDEGQSLSIFLNSGGWLFARRDAAVDRPINDITLRDLTGDGILDLVLAGGLRGKETFDDGRVYVLSGNGNGTFNAPATYDTGRGAFRVVVGDFTHDGRLDIATGNRSAVLSACGSDRLTYWDTVSILGGRSDGTFAPAVHFSLSTDFEPYDPTFINTLTSLNTSDVDRDGYTDLIVSGGVVLASREPRENRAPVPQGDDVFADGPRVNVVGRAVEPDFHALSFTWTDDEGRVVGTEPSPCVTVPTGTSTLTLTVDDGHGGTASTTVTSSFPTEQVLEIVNPSDFETETLLHSDAPFEIRWRRSPTLFSSFDVLVQDFGDEDGMTPVAGCQDLPGNADRCVWQQPGPASAQYRQFVVRGHRNDGVRDAIDLSAPFEVRASSPGSLPTDWRGAHLGNGGPSGSARFEEGVFTIAGSGADIWGAADEFYWAHQTIAGDFEFVARVVGIENVDRWVKAGLMIRAGGGDAGAAHASLFATPGRGIAFQRRAASGGASVHTAGPLLTAPVWLRLVRAGSNVSAYYRSTAAEGWTRVGDATIALADSVDVGLAVSSHVQGVLAAASFDHVSIARGATWQSAKVGSAAGGSFAENAGTVTVRGAGLDIWNNADGFQYVFQRITGDATIVARVASLERTHAWAKAGVMIRETAAAHARHAFSLVSAGKGLALQYRPEAGGTSFSGTITPGAAPQWVRLERRGDTFISSASDDGVEWQEIGRVTMAMNSDVLAGLAVTSHVTAVSTTAVFDHVRIDR